MRRASAFIYIMKMISNFPIIYISETIFYEIAYSILLHLRVILTLCLLTVTFFSFQNQLFFLCVLLKIHKTFSCYFFLDTKYACFYMVKLPDCWHWISSRNIFSNFCCWRFFWIVCAAIYFFNLTFKVSVNNIRYFIWFHIWFKF